MPSMILGIERSRRYCCPATLERHRIPPSTTCRSARHSPLGSRRGPWAGCSNLAVHSGNSSKNERRIGSERRRRTWSSRRHASPIATEEERSPASSGPFGDDPSPETAWNSSRTYAGSDPTSCEAREVVAGGTKTWTSRWGRTSIRALSSTSILCRSKSSAATLNGVRPCGVITKGRPRNGEAGLPPKGHRIDVMWRRDK